MLKLSLAAAIGLTVATPAAQADPIPIPAPMLILPGGPAPVPVHGLSAYDTPSFDRLIGMCASFGFDCSVPRVAADPLAEAARDDLEKLLALMAADWAEMPDAFGPTAIAPVQPDPFGFFGYSAPQIAPYPGPHIGPHIGIDLFPFGHRVPTVPRSHGLFGHVLPHGAYPGDAGPRGLHPHGPIFPWPTL